MRFSIAFLIAATVLAALLVNYFRLAQEHNALRRRTIILQDEAAEMLPQMMWERSQVNKEAKELPRVLASIQTATDLNVVLRKAFDQHCDRVGQLQPSKSEIAIVRVPKISNGELLLDYRIYVPEQLTATFRIELIDVADATPRSYPPPKNQDWPLDLQVPPGNSRFSLVFKQKSLESTADSSVSGEFLYSLNGDEKPLFDLPRNAGEYSFSGPNLSEPFYVSYSPLQLGKVTPGDYDFAVRLQLITGISK